MSTNALVLTGPLFPNYTQLRSFLPQYMWHTLRALSVVSALAMAFVLWSIPALGLPLFWGLAVPALPFVFFVAPGIWRNICPLAATNQLPRLAGLSRAATNATLSQGLAFPVGILAFFVLVTGRKVLFNESGPATALLIVGAMAAALIGGLLFKGKSGWCSSICPLLPVQRLYGQTPFIQVANTHCQPCVGCAKNCYDFNPGTAYLADQYDGRRRYRSFRRFFAGVFPGFVLAFYLVPAPPLITPGQMVLQMLFYMAISLALFNVLDVLIPALVNVTPILFAVAAINIYYWFSATTLSNTLAGLGLPMHEAAIWGLRLLILGSSLFWLLRSTQRERLFLADQAQQADSGALRLTPIVLETIKEFEGALRSVRLLLPIKSKVPGALEAISSTTKGLPESAQLTIEPEGQCVSLRSGQSLLDAIESCDGKIEAGCRMGLCGADPIAVTSGMEHLSPIGDDERATLKRLGCADNTRLACSARMRHSKGEVTIELQAQRNKASPAAAFADATVASGDPGIRRIVIIGNGIAGITAAEHARNLHPTCEIHVISREKHAFYNRMGISRLINGRSGMQGLHLQPESWYQEQRITSWLNTQVLHIDTKARSIRLATNEQLAYDRLILANGSSAWVPPIDGFGLPGSFVLRAADEAMGLRDYIQQHGSRTAVIAGAGLLGLEAAHALQKLGLKVAILSNTPYILDRQLDSRSSHFLQRHLESLGLEIVTTAEAAGLLSNSDGQLCGIRLKDGGELPADIFVACTGVRPNIELAQAAGLATKRGILVDDCMQTSSPDVYAAGDVAEHEGVNFGLWPVAVEQGRVAAINALGGKQQYVGYVPSTALKVSGIDLLSIGKFSARQEEEQEIVDEQAEAGQYRKLVLASGRLIGAILIGYPDQAAQLAELVRRGTDLTPHLGALERGNWTALSQLDFAA